MSAESKVVKIVTPAVSTSYLKYPEGDLLEFIFDIERDVAIYKYEGFGLQYLDHNDYTGEASMITIDSNVFVQSTVSSIKNNFDFVYDNSEEMFRFSCPAFSNMRFYFKDEKDMKRFKRLFYAAIFPEIKKGSELYAALDV